ncbi:MAG: efflux transporter periplasmic adaptor subunit [Betaproteobacteria bacterium]|nr:efflux transporter periplasmic adaptor subunit [Betaproteobacteria bacterium]
MNKTFRTLFCLGAAFAAASAFAQAGKPPVPVVPVAGTPAENDGANTPAIIVAGDEAVLSAQMAGRIQKVTVGLGTSFAADTVLVEFDCAERQAQLDAAKAESLGARETHLAKLRLQGLGAAGELEVTTAAAAAGKAAAQVKLIDSQISYCKVAAPYAGRVAKVRVKASETVNIGQPLLEIVNTGGLKATMNVPASYMQWLRPGSPVTLKSPNGKTYSAKVARLNSRIDGVSQTLEVEAMLGRAAGLIPGMVLDASFPKRPQ